MKSFLGSMLGLAAGALLIGSQNAQAAGSALVVDTIPAGSVVNSAIFSIYVIEGNQSATVNVHRVTANWSETSVTWNNFGGAFDPAILDSFVGNPGWQSADITGLVQGWVDGSVANQGILLEQGQTYFTLYESSDNASPALRPMLEINYTPPGGSMQQLVLQRPGATPEVVTDAYIWEAEPNYTGNNQHLYSGLSVGIEKQCLLQFEFTVGQGGPGTGTPGYWKNHPEAWPVDSIVIGGNSYTKAQAIAWMNTPVNGDKTKTMFAHLVCAKLNVLIGNAHDCIDATIASADAWMALHPVGSGVAGNSAAWTVGAPLANMLDAYNNGLLCAPHRD
jgi:hypothetical protein